MPTPIVDEFPLASMSMGTKRFLKVIRYGDRRKGKKAYIQAGLHADEAPGFLVMHHLIQRLERANAGNAILGEIVLVPVANPIGLSQWRNEMLHGRFDFFNSVNFNRSYLDITALITERVKERLCHDPGENIAAIREVAGEALQTIEPEDESEHLKRLLLLLSYDADVVLDLHCDHQALIHVYMGTPLWPDAADLPALLGAEVTLLAEDSGVTPFDEACSRYWWRLAEKFPEYPIPPACLSATVELRGICDVTHEIAAQDAANIIRFLQHRGIIAGPTDDMPPLLNDPTPLSGVDYIKAPASGVVVFRKAPGEWAEKGEVIAEIVTPLSLNTEERITEIRSNTQGLLFACNCDRIARPGRIIAKIAGKTPLTKKDSDLLTP